MIVDPDFLDHWKTRLAVDLLDGDELAPLYVLRIWAHCQARKKESAFSITTAGLRALCRCTTASAERLERALCEAGFISRHGEYISVIDWAERNKKLVTAWKNGAAGGSANRQRAAERKANSDPPATETGPNANRNATEREAIRSREEIEKEQKPKATAARAAPPALQALVDAGVDEQTAADWIAHRKAKRATASATVLADRRRECEKAGVSLAAGLALEVSRGWQGLKADWILNHAAANPRSPPAPTRQDRAREWADFTTGAKANDERIIDITPSAAAPPLG